MSTMVAELYEALRKAGVDGLRADVSTELSGMKVELIKWNVGAVAVLTAIFAAIVRLR